MNILLATNTDLDRGGISMFMLQWIRGIRAVDEKCTIAAYFRAKIEDKAAEEEYRSYGVKIYTGNIPGSVNFKNPKANKKVRGDIERILRKDKIDIVHINSRFFAFHVLLLSVAKKAGIPIRVSHFHGSLVEPFFDRIVHTFLRLRIRSLATVYAGCSKEKAVYLFGKKGIQSDKWRLIPNTIQTERFKFNEAERKKKRELIGVADDEILLGAVGRVEKEKNHIFLIGVLKKLLRSMPKAKLIILGDGSERDTLQEKSRELGLYDKVILYGATDDVPGWLSAMDYYLMPSLSEGFPISAVEAQASGLVCLLSDSITKEADITADVYHLPIDKGAREWTKAVLRIAPTSATERLKFAEIIKSKGFDEMSTPDYVRQLYGLSSQD